MKISKWLLASAMVLSVPAFAESFVIADSLPPRFCLQNFNAYGPIYAKGVEERTERMSSALQAFPKCEVVHLQEVWNEPQINQIEGSLKHQYSITTPNREARIGVMSLFMGDIKETATHSFVVNNEGGILDSVREVLDVKKAFHVVRTAFFGVPEEFYFINTHLHPTSQAVRLTQILDLLQWRLQHQDLKLLLSGDFNADDGSLERAMVLTVLGSRDAMEDHLGGYPEQGFCTYCDENPLGWLRSDRVFDYVFYSNIGTANSSLNVLSGEVNMRGTPRRPLSDHYGVRIDFSVNPKTLTTDAQVMELRRQQALRLLFRAEEIFFQQKAPEFLPYQERARALREQLQSRRGDFHSYFTRFR